MRQANNNNQRQKVFHACENILRLVVALTEITLVNY